MGRSLAACIYKWLMPYFIRLFSFLILIQSPKYSMIV